MDPKELRSPAKPDDKSDEVIRIEDLAPREDVKGGRKIVLGEDLTEPTRPPRDVNE
jgi:hypothetical protein